MTYCLSTNATARNTQVYRLLNQIAIFCHLDILRATQNIFQLSHTRTEHFPAISTFMGESSSRILLPKLFETICQPSVFSTHYVLYQTNETYYLI